MTEINISKLLYFDKDKLVVLVIPDGKTIPDIFTVIETITISEKDNLYIYFAELKTSKSYNQFINECNDFTLENLKFELYMNIYTNKHFNINQFNNLLKLCNYCEYIKVTELNSGIISEFSSLLFNSTDKYYQITLNCPTPQKLAVMYMLVRFYIENKDCILEKTNSFANINNFIGYDIIPRTNTMNFKITSSSILPNYSMYANNLNCIFDNKLYKHVFNMNTIKYNKQLNIENNTYTDNRCNIQCNIFNFLTYELCMINMYNDELLEEYIKYETERNIITITNYLSDLIKLDFSLDKNFIMTKLWYDELTYEMCDELFNNLKIISYYKLINSRDYCIQLDDEIDFCDNDIIVEKLKNISSLAEFINSKLTTEIINKNILDILLINLSYESFKIQKIKKFRNNEFHIYFFKIIDIIEICKIIKTEFSNSKEQTILINKLNLIDIVENYLLYTEEYLECIYETLEIFQDDKKPNNIVLTDEELFENLLTDLDSYENIKYEEDELTDNETNNSEINNNNQDEYTLIISSQDGNINDDNINSSNSGILGSLTSWLFKG